MKKINKILITGGSGFIGTNLHLKLKKNKNNIVINIDTKKPLESNLLDDWVSCDIRNYSKLKKIFNNFKPNTVYHLAARTDLDGKTLRNYDTNTKGTKNILSLITSNKKVKKFLYTSTRFVFNMDQNPKNDFDYSASTVYGESKVISEKIYFEYLKKLPRNSVLTRPTSIWGPYFGEPYYNFFKIIKKKLYFHPTLKKTYKSFGYVENTVLQMIKLCNSKIVKKNEVYYLCDYKPYEIFNFANLISKRLNKTRIIKIPYFITYFFSLIGSMLKFIDANFPLTLFRLKNMTTNSVFKNTNLKKIQNRLPYNLPKSINKTCDWFIKNETNFK